eukprot:gene15933-7262_t
MLDTDAALAPVAITQESKLPHTEAAPMGQEDGETVVAEGKWTLLPERVVRPGVVAGAGRTEDGIGAVGTAGEGSRSVSRHKVFQLNFKTVASCCLNLFRETEFTKSCLFAGGSRLHHSWINGLNQWIHNLRPFDR